MEREFDLERFITAQSGHFDRALREIKNGRKTSHWMWFIFPQYKNLGRSPKSVHYAIDSKAEAVGYLNHPLLGARLKEISEAFLLIEDKSARDILGSPDDLKIKSSMTLFDAVQADTDLFERVLEKYFKGKKCGRTLGLLNGK